MLVCRNQQGCSSADGELAGKRFSIRFSGEYSYEIHEIHRPSFYFFFESALRIGFEASWVYMIEPLPDGSVDRLSLGDINFLVRVFQHERAQIRIGVGLRYMDDYLGFEPGFNGVFGFDAFPVRYLIFSVNTDLGMLGQALFVHSRMTFGAIFLNTEIYIGYDAVLVSSVSLHGPVVGLRFWL